MQEFNFPELPNLSDLPDQASIDIAQSRITKIIRAYHERSLHELVIHLDAQQIRDEIAYLKRYYIFFDEKIYDGLAIVLMFRDKTNYYFTIEELKDLEKKGLDNYLQTIKKQYDLCLKQLTTYIEKNFYGRAAIEALPREDILKYLQELIRLYSACVPYNIILIDSFESARVASTLCANTMVALLSLWPSETTWPLESNQNTLQLDYSAMKPIVARMREDVLLDRHGCVDELVRNITICSVCDEIDNIMARAGNPAIRTELESQLQELFKSINESLVEKSLNRDRYEKIDAFYFRELILINLSKYGLPQFQVAVTPLTRCLISFLKLLFHAYFKHSKITSSNFAPYLELAEKCSTMGVVNCEQELVSIITVYLNAWVERTKNRLCTRTDPKTLREITVLQIVSSDELKAHQSIIHTFRKALRDLSTFRTICANILYPHFDKIMPLISVDLANREAFLALIQYAFDIMHPSAVDMLNYYYISYTEHLVSRSYGKGHDVDGRITEVKPEEIKNWQGLLKQLDMQPSFWEATPRKFDIASYYLRIIYRYFSHTHITGDNVNFAYDLINELKILNSPETKKILIYFYTDFIVYYGYRLNFDVVKNMLNSLKNENDLSIQEKQQLFCLYLKSLFSEVIIPQMVNEPKPSGLNAFMAANIEANEVFQLTQRSDCSLDYFHDICDIIIRLNKRIFGNDPQYVTQLREIISLLTALLSAEPPAIASPKKMGNDADEKPKLFINIKALSASEQVDGVNINNVELRVSAQAISFRSPAVDTSKQATNPGQSAENSDIQQLVKLKAGDKKGSSKDSQPSTEIDGSEAAASDFPAVTKRHGFLWRNEKKVTSAYVQDSRQSDIDTPPQKGKETQSELPVLTERKRDSLRHHSRKPASISNDSPVIAKSSKPTTAPANSVDNIAVIDAREAKDHSDERSKQNPSRVRQLA